MQVKLFVLTNGSTDHGEEELNKFLRSHRVLDTVCEFCHENGGYWSVLVKYLDGDPVAESPPAWRKEKKDVTKEMDEEQRKRYERFRGISCMRNEFQCSI